MISHFILLYWNCLQKMVFPMILILSGMPYAVSGLSMYVPYFANCQDTMVGQQCSTSIHSTTEGHACRQWMDWNRTMAGVPYQPHKEGSSLGCLPSRDRIMSERCPAVIFCNSCFEIQTLHSSELLLRETITTAFRLNKVHTLD